VSPIVLLLLLTLVKKKLYTLVIFYLFINVKVALFAAFSISAGNKSSISALLILFSLHSIFTNVIMWNSKCFTKRNENFFDVYNKQMTINDYLPVFAAEIKINMKNTITFLMQCKPVV
jgi:hypothetical protein